MAHPNLPAEERVRELTSDPNLSLEEANRHADLFLAAGNYPVALMFLDRTRDAQRLGRVKVDAIRMGDAFLLHNVDRFLPESVTADDWRQAAEQARRDGKLLFAREAYARSGDEAKAAEVREEWLKIFPPKPVAGPAATA